MLRSIACLTLATLFVIWVGPAAATELVLDIRDGRVTLVAVDVSLPHILAEWARVGQTRIVNVEQVTGPLVTIELRGVPESEALAALLRPVAGYVAAPRRPGDPGVSVYDRILILAKSTPPVPAAQPVAPPQPSPITRALSQDATTRNEETPGFVTVGTAPTRPTGIAPGTPTASPAQGSSMSQQGQPPASAAQVPPTATRAPGVVVSPADLYPGRVPPPPEQP